MLNIFHILINILNMFNILQIKISKKRRPIETILEVLEQKDFCDF